MAPRISSTTRPATTSGTHVERCINCAYDVSNVPTWSPGNATFDCPECGFRSRRGEWWEARRSTSFFSFLRRSYKASVWCVVVAVVLSLPVFCINQGNYDGTLFWILATTLCAGAAAMWSVILPFYFALRLYRELRSKYRKAKIVSGIRTMQSAIVAACCIAGASLFGLIAIVVILASL